MIYGEAKKSMLEAVFDGKIDSQNGTTMTFGCPWSRLHMTHHRNGYIENLLCHGNEGVKHCVRTQHRLQTLPPLGRAFVGSTCG